jgi:tetratricopeptide (TPR) repeat protein
MRPGMPTKRKRPSTNVHARSRIQSSYPRLAVAALASVFALKLVVMLQLKDHVLTQPDGGLDTTAYVALADRVLAGDVGLGPGLYFLSPLYSYFLAAVLGVGHSFTLVRLCQIALGTAAVALMFIIADEWYGRRAAWLAAALATLTGVFTFYESLILQTALDPFLTAAELTCLTLGLRRADDRWITVAGFAFGIHVCNRPNIAAPAVVVALLLATLRRWRGAVAFAIALAIALVPVTLRNIVVSGSWSPVTASHGGLNFFIGNNAGADGTFHAVADITPDIRGQQEDTRRVAERAMGHALDDAGVSWFFYRRGLSWIHDQPLAAATLFARKLSLMFSGKYLWLNYSYRFFADDASTLLRVLVVGPWLLIPFGLVGLAIAAPERQPAYLIWTSFIPIYALAVAAFYVSDRYQLPMLIPLCASAGGAADALLSAALSRRWLACALAGAAVIALLFWINRPLPYDEGVAEERTRMAERLIALGRYDDATRWIESAERAHSRPAEVHFRVGQRFAAQDQPGAAIAHFQRALTLDPNQPVIAYALGETLLESARPQEAIAPLRLALDRGVHTDQAGYDLARALGATGEREQAVRVLEQLHPARSDDADRWVALSRLAVQLREAGLAQGFARKAIALQPDLAAAHGQLGDGLNLEGRWAEAARELSEAIRLDPLSSLPHIGLAVADANMGRPDDARFHVEEALRLDPRSEPARRVQQMLERSVASDNRTNRR